MDNVLIITAHPSSHNLTRGMSDIIEEEKTKQGKTVKVVDLYKDKQMPFLAFENQEDTAKEDETRTYYQEQITWADEIVIIYPLWWGSFPGIIKNWVDYVFTMGFAAKYNEKGMPEGLLQGRSVRVLCTSGAPTFLYCLNGIVRANKNIWKKSIVTFCGMKFDGYHLYGGVDTSGKNVDKIFKSVRKLAQK